MLTAASCSASGLHMMNLGLLPYVCMYVCIYIYIYATQLVFYNIYHYIYIYIYIFGISICLLAYLFECIYTNICKYMQMYDLLHIMRCSSWSSWVFEKTKTFSR